MPKKKKENNSEEANKPAILDNNLPKKKPHQPDSQEKIEIPPKYLKILEAHLESFSGPIPTPELLKAYEDIFPGSAERIFRMAEIQAEHRQSIEKVVVNGDSRRADRGLNYGLIVALGALVVTLVLVLTGHEWAGGIIGSLDLIGLVGVFVYGSERRRSERAIKAEKMREVIQSKNPDVNTK